MNGSATRRGFLVGAGATVLAGCLGLMSDDTDIDPPESLDSAWPQPGYDHRIRNYTPTASGPLTEIDELWTVEGETSYTPPVIADEQLFVGSADGSVRAFDARDGEELWATSVGDEAGQPQVGDELVYVATEEATVALSPEDGEEQWRIDGVPDVSPSFGMRSETPSPDGILYTPHGLYGVRESARACPDDADDYTCPAGSGGEGATTAAFVSRYNPVDGSLRWEESVFSPLTAHLFAGEDSLFVSSGGVGTAPWYLTPENGRVVEDAQRISHGPVEHCYSDGAVFGFDDWNGIYRRQTVTGDTLDTAVSEGVPIAAHNLATDGERCYLSAADGHGLVGVVCLSVDGEKLWSHELDTVVGMATVADEVVLYRDEETLYCVDPEDGTERWTRGASDMGSEFALADDLLYTVDEGTIRAYRAV